MSTSLTMIGNRPVLRLERHLAHPPEKVWKAVTDPAEMAHWFPATVHTDLSIGAAMRFSFDDQLDLGTDADQGEILELDPPKVYAFRWNDSVLRFELIPQQEGCLLVFTHTLNGTDTSGDLPSVARQAPGWDGCVDALQARLDGVPASEKDAAWFLARAEHYVEKFRLADGTVTRTDDGCQLRFERDLVQTPDAVWATLTEAGEPALDQAPPVPFTHGYLTPGVVTEVDPGHVLEYTSLQHDEPAGRVRVELRHQKPIGCRLVLTHTVPDALADQHPTLLAAWHTHLELLFAALHGDIRCPWPTERTDELRQRYAPTEPGETLRTVDGRAVLRLQRHLPHPPDKVWAALTEPDQLSQWYPFPVATLELKIGGTIAFDDGEGNLYHGAITELDPPRVFAFREEDDLLRIELHPHEAGTVLTFTHTFDDRSLAINTAAGWHRSLDALESTVDGQTVEWPDNGAELRAHYTGKFGLDPDRT